MFGPNLISEMYGCDRDALADEALLKEVLEVLPDKMGMTKVTEPLIWKYEGLHKDDWGLSGVIIIAESHLAFHTFPDKGFMTADIFSCKDFDTSFVMTYLSELFNPDNYEERLIMRGREFPKSVTKAEMIIDTQRQQVANTI